MGSSAYAEYFLVVDSEEDESYGEWFSTDNANNNNTERNRNSDEENGDNREIEQAENFGAYDVFCSAKAGNLKAVKYFIEERGVNVNSRYHDATPLFYACLCGHYEVCEYLLEKGAFCAENTYDGDRCLYGALTDEIRELLRSYATRNSPVTVYAQQIGNLRNTSSQCIQCRPDFCFKLKGGNSTESNTKENTIPAHKFILASRIPFIAKKCHPGGDWFEKDFVEIQRGFTENAFEALIKYCYMGVVDIAFEDVDDFFNICGYFHMNSLIEAVRPRIAKAKQTAIAKTNKAKKNRVARFLDVNPLESKQLEKDLRRAFLYSNGYGHDNPKSFRWTCDVAFSCNNIGLFAHHCILCSRSQYFSTLLALDSRVFVEGSNKTIDLNHLSPSNLTTILDYLYSGSPDFAGYLSDNIDNILQLIDTTSAMLLPELQTLLSKYIIDLGIVNLESVFSWLEISDLYDAGILRNHCTAILGEHFINLSAWESFDYKEDASLIWQCLEKENDIVAEFAQHLVKLANKKDPRQEKEWYKPQKEGEEGAADFLIAEVREGMIENMFCTYFSMAKRDKITDGFELASDIWRRAGLTNS